MLKRLDLKQYLLILGLSSIVGHKEYYFTVRDNFRTAVVAGSIDTTLADRGPGTRSVTDAESKLSISS